MLARRREEERERGRVDVEWVGPFSSPPPFFYKCAFSSDLSQQVFNVK